MQGIITILKPSGLTSQQVVNIVKHYYNAKKVGHLGTLDPSGTGVLPICVGKATKLFDYYLLKDKIYRTVFVFGKSTDTLDSDGMVINEGGYLPTKEEINNILEDFKGDFDQIPPNYSRKCINGKRAYELARQNLDFVLKPKRIKIYNIKMIEQLSLNSFLFEIHCSSGTYIRSIVRDMAKRLNTFGYMGAIIRTKSGSFSLNNSVLLENISQNDLKPLELCIDDFEKLELDSVFFNKIINGVKISINKENKKNIIVYCKNQLIGIADIENNILKIKTNLR